MPATAVAVLYPGEMGAAVGACLVSRGHRVVTALAGRSQLTRSRAAKAGIEDLGAIEQALEAAGMVLSVCPPHGALELARAVARCGFRGLFVDANAIAPDTAREVGRVVEATGAAFVDGGIIGAPPGKGAKPRLYLAGARAIDVTALFADTDVKAVAIDGGIGAASALKVCYAAWSKGSAALLANIRALAQKEGVDATLIEEWNHSQPGLLQRSENVTGNARKAWRWIAEMEEISRSFAAAGLPDGFHLASAEIYTRLARFKDAETPPAMDEVTAALGGARNRDVGPRR